MPPSTHLLWLRVLLHVPRLLLLLLLLLLWQRGNCAALVRRPAIVACCCTPVHVRTHSRWHRTHRPHAAARPRRPCRRRHRRVHVKHVKVAAVAAAAAIRGALALGSAAGTRGLDISASLPAGITAAVHCTALKRGVVQSAAVQSSVVHRGAVCQGDATLRRRRTRGRRRRPRCERCRCVNLLVLLLSRRARQEVIQLQLHVRRVEHACLQLALERRIPVVFDRIVGAAGQQLGNGRPPVAARLVSLGNDGILPA
mmetsp:Transcript_8236/g.24845  ORF Transcript_8236/g.24845 Transcript_8236/m.24845 type:complete len:255 (+) Transcript_8236:103-867(+)